MSSKTSAQIEESKKLRTVYGACPHDCPDCCALETQVDELGRAVSVHGRNDHPVTKGWLCAKVNRYLERVYHPDRLRYYCAPWCAMHPSIQLCGHSRSGQ